MVFGANGKTGELTVARALAAGHTVTVFVHDASHTQQPGVTVVAGDAGDLATVRAGIAGQDAVIDTIGGTTPYKDTELERSAARNIIEAMHAEGARRLVVVSMMGVGDSKNQAPFWYEHLMLPTFLRGADKDKTAMEAEVKASALDFVIVRPPILKDEPASKQIHIVPPQGTGHTITRADLAQFLVDQLTTDTHLGQAVTVANH